MSPKFQATKGFYNKSSNLLEKVIRYYKVAKEKLWQKCFILAHTKINQIVEKNVQEPERKLTYLKYMYIH